MNRPPESNPDARSTPPRPRRKRTVGWRSRDVARAAALAFGVYWMARLFWIANPLFLTAFLGVLFGLAVSAGVDRLSFIRIPRGAKAGLIVLTFIGALVAFGAAVAPTLREQGGELQRKIPEAIDRLEHWIDQRKASPLGIVLPSSPSPVTTTQPGDTVTAPKAPTLRQRLGEQFGSATRYLFPFLHSTLAALAGVLLIIFMAIYIAADPDMYHRGIITLFPKRHRRRAGEIFSAIADALRKWLVTQLIAMTTIGAVTTIVLLVLRVKAAFALGVIAGLLEFVPTLGPILSAVPAIAMGFLDTPEKALYVAIAYVGIQFIENHLLIPLLMKGGMDLPPALTILAQALMALLFGFLGLMCAVPLLAACMVGIKMLYLERVIGEKPFGPGEDPHKGLE
jgi:predicted PurR-regulated permease PerM